MSNPPPLRTPQPALPETTVSEELLLRYATLIYDLTGIRISPQKRMLLSNRVRRRLRETGIPDFEAYYQHLKRVRPDDPEWDCFLQEITTHETFLFRDEAHWNWLQNQYLPALVESARSGAKARRWRVWSAACSTGDEACSIAVCLANALNAAAGWDIRIVGTDIGIEAVRQAKQATFCPRAMRLVPEALKQRYFAALERDRWQLRPPLTSWLDFRQHNLMEPFAKSEYDVVFLKNVLIYFDDASRVVVLRNIRQALKPGGWLVAGAAEGVSDLVRDFERVQPWLFRWHG